MTGSNIWKKNSRKPVLNIDYLIISKQKYVRLHFDLYRKFLQHIDGNAHYAGEGKNGQPPAISLSIPSNPVLEENIRYKLIEVFAFRDNSLMFVVANKVR